VIEDLRRLRSRGKEIRDITAFNLKMEDERNRAINIDRR